VITAVDTSVLVDVFRGDPDCAEASAEALRRCIREGRLVVCDVVWAELAAVFASRETLEAAMSRLGVSLLPMSQGAATLAGQIWRQYRSRGGTRERMVADFLIAAHALTQCDRLLTRDRGFYRDYFKHLKVLQPSS